MGRAPMRDPRFVSAREARADPGYDAAMRALRTSALAISLFGAAAAQQPEAVPPEAVPMEGAPLDDARFAQLVARLTPDPDASWRSVPWRIDLLAAQAEAAQHKKPLFVWAMDGHPLGCT